MRIVEKESADPNENLKRLAAKSQDDGDVDAEIEALKEKIKIDK